jgi:hypothetical protein
MKPKLACLLAALLLAAAALPRAGAAERPDNVLVIFTGGARQYGRLVGFENGRFRVKFYQRGRWSEPMLLQPARVREIRFAQILPGHSPAADLPEVLAEARIAQLRAAVAARLAAPEQNQNFELVLAAVAGWAAQTGEAWAVEQLIGTLRGASGLAPPDLDLLVYAALIAAGKTTEAAAFRSRRLSTGLSPRQTRAVARLADPDWLERARASLADNVTRLLGADAPTAPAAPADPRIQRCVNVALGHARTGLRTDSAVELESALVLVMALAAETDQAARPLGAALRSLREEAEGDAQHVALTDVLIYAAIARAGEFERARRYHARHIAGHTDAAVSALYRKTRMRSQEITRRANALLKTAGAPTLPLTPEPQQGPPTPEPPTPKPPVTPPEEPPATPEPPTPPPDEPPRSEEPPDELEMKAPVRIKDWYKKR